MAMLAQIAPFIILIVIMYFMLIRPQKKKDKEIAEMRAALKIGDTIVTIGGLVGKIVKIKDDAVVLQVGPEKVKMEFMKWAVSTVLEKKVGGSNETTTSKRPKSLKKDDNDKAAAEAKKADEKVEEAKVEAKDVNEAANAEATEAEEK